MDVKNLADELKNKAVEQVLITSYFLAFKAETDHTRPNGKIYHNRFLYSITREIKE